MTLKRLVIYALKGGVGKTTVTIALAKSLQSKGFKIGIYDVDITGPKIPTAIGIQKVNGRFPLPEVDVSTSKMYPMKFNGFEIFSEAFIFGENALTWHGGDQRVKSFGLEMELKGTGIYSMVEQNLESVTFSPDRDYILYDMPPSSSDPALSLFEHLPDIYACILVCQPTSQSVGDIIRSISMLKQKKVPLLGLVGNMAEAVCPCCQSAYYPFSDECVDLKDFCKAQEIPYLVSVPLTPNKMLRDMAFNKLAELVLSCKPVEIWKKGLKVSLEQGLMKKMTISAAHKAAREP